MNQQTTQKQDVSTAKFPQANVVGTYAPELLALGYEAKRKEQRLIYVMPVSMQYEDKTFALKTKDISINGLKLFMPRTLLFTGKQVKITFDAFVEEQESYTDDSKKEYFQDITYTIVDVTHTAEKTFVSLIQKNLSDIAKSHFNQFINSNRIQFKLDAQDVLLVAKAKYIEHIYKHNMTGIPFFISREREQGKVNLFVENIIETVKNKELVDFFSITSKKVYDYDFTPFMLPHRLAHFAKVADGNGIALLFAYWENEKLHTLCDFEFNQPSDLVDIVLKVIAHHGKVFCINYKQVKHPDKFRLKKITERIMQDMGKKEAVNLLKKTQRYFVQLMLTDITEIYKSESQFASFFHAEEGHESKIKVWCENKLIYISTENILGYVDFDEVKRPEKIKFHVHKVRYDVRYIHTMPVDLNIRNVYINAETIDFSKNGIGVTFKYRSDYQLIKNDPILVSFPEFSHKISEIDFFNINFKIASVTYDKDKVELGLVRMLGEKNRKVGNFFNNLINKNKNKLSLCDRDHFEYSLGQLIEAYVDTNINSIPLSITRDRKNGKFLKNVGLPPVDCHLAEKFLVKMRGYNFKMLTEESRLKELYTRTIKRNPENEHQNIILFMFKSVNDEGLEYINSYTSSEIFLPQQVIELLATLFAHDGVCVKLTFVNKMEIDPGVINEIIDTINPVNRLMGSNFRQELSEIVGFIDMVDITPAYRVIHELQK